MLNFFGGGGGAFSTTILSIAYNSPLIGDNLKSHGCPASWK